MRRSIIWLFLLGLLALASPAPAATGRVIKVLPFFLDKKGQHSVSPSLFERDAYQAVLRQHPDRRSGIMYDVHWKTKGRLLAPLRLRVELRGIAEGNLPKQRVIERPVQPGHGWFGLWSSLSLVGDDYKAFGEVTAWRVTLWEGERLLDQQQSFLW